MWDNLEVVRVGCWKVVVMMMKWLRLLKSLAS